ncbi:MAG TPA: hypothetical protein VN665_00900, partial [Candidatus Paceibacterota bacterium]|nr:hypothetical protein [Candidatus Paceibacterota bacterium]
EQDRLIALKQVRREVFANDEEMRKSKAFYDYLKNSPGFGEFVPDTLYFKARLHEGDEPTAFILQQFLEGKTIDQLSDDELYADPEVVEQLAKFAKASAEILKTTREEKIAKPDFGTAGSADANAQKQGNMFGNSRFSTNVLITPKHDQKEGEEAVKQQRVFFVDTGVNADERVSKVRQFSERHFMGRLREFNFNRWSEELEKKLADLEK